MIMGARLRKVALTAHVACSVGSLGAIATPTLTTDDSATLRWLAETTAEAPLVLLVDDGGPNCRVADGQGLYVAIECAGLRRL